MIKCPPSTVGCIAMLELSIIIDSSFHIYFLGKFSQGPCNTACDETEIHKGLMNFC